MYIYSFIYYKIVLKFFGNIILREKVRFSN